VAGKTTLNELAAIFSKCAVVVSADSGPLHLASASGAMTVGLFGPTSYKITGPRGKKGSIIIQKDFGCPVPCYVADCGKEYSCMRSITVDEVYHAAAGVISGEK
jgi:ADP-heptose:LPS heptosyltransferase